MKNWIVNAALTFVSVAVSLVLFEAGYRYYRYQKAPQDFIQEADRPLAMTFFSRSIWEFDEDLGFRYRRDAPVVIGSLSDGQVAGCTLVGPWEFGGGNAHKESWADGAELRILVLGDSFTAITENGRTWTHYLQDELQSRLRKKVDVINSGLDGIGILQMFDVAARKVPELKPNLAIFAFVTDDLTRARIWRTTAEVNGRLRVFTTTRPEKNPDLRFAVDTILMNPDVTLDWCNRSPRPNRANDPLAQDLEERYRLAAEQADNRYDLYALNRSVFLERTLRRKSFRHLADPRGKPINPRHELGRYSDDERMARNARAIRESGTPVMLFHLAMRRELRGKQEYLLGDERARSLLDDLQRLTGTKVAETTQYAAIEPDKVESVARSSVDEHPSAYGMQFYAKAVAEAIVRANVSVSR